MALTMRPEQHVKLTKNERNKLAKKIQKGWKSTIMLPDYGIDDNGQLIIRSDKIRRNIKFVKILEDHILIEKAIDKKKNIAITWDRIHVIQNSMDLRDGLEIIINDGTKIEFSIFSSFKIAQTKEFIINYVNEKKIALGHQIFSKID